MDESSNDTRTLKLETIPNPKIDPYLLELHNLNMDEWLNNPSNVHVEVRHVKCANLEKK